MRLTQQHSLPLTMKDNPPNILFSITRGPSWRGFDVLAQRSLRRSSYRGLLFLGDQDLRKPVEAGFPPGSGHQAGQRRGKARVPNRDSRSSVDLL
jgi:hypothetical protein